MFVGGLVEAVAGVQRVIAIAAFDGVVAAQRGDVVAADAELGIELLDACELDIGVAELSEKRVPPFCVEKLPLSVP